jgi:DNA-binding transcriptional ArsR family regulator
MYDVTSVNVAYGVNGMLKTRSTDAESLKAKLFCGFADPSRLNILEALREGPNTVSVLVEATGLSQSNVSNHLSCLHDCGLVVSVQQGRYVSYQLSEHRVNELLQRADELLAEVARGVYTCTHYEVEEDRRDGTSAN